MCNLTYKGLRNLLGAGLEHIAFHLSGRTDFFGWPDDGLSLLRPCGQFTRGTLSRIRSKYMKELISIFALLSAFLLLVPPVRGDEKSSEEMIFRTVVSKDGLQQADIVGGSYFFEPNHIIVRVNVPVELKVRKESGMVPHDIVMKSPEAGMDFKESLETDPKTIRFTPNKIGIYPFYCDKKLLFFESHRDKGMKGVIDVIQ